MSYNGQRPKPDDQRIRRNKPVYDKMPLQWDGITRGPTLPTSYKWSPQTKKWWKALRNSPQAAVCIESDWWFLIDTALLYDKMWKNAETISAAELKSLSSEFRIRMSAYATTWDDRLKMRVEIKSPAHEAAAEHQAAVDATEAINYLEQVNKMAAKQRK